MSTPLLKPRLARPGQVPYGGGYSLNLPDLGLVGEGTNFEMLMTRIRNYRVANGIPCGLGLVEEVEREVCRAYPSECVESDARVPNREQKFSFADVIHGTKTMVRHVLGGRVLVDDAEAARRAEICSRCPNNISFTAPCNSLCGELKDIVMGIIGHRRTAYDERLRSCAICACFNASAIWVPLEVQTADLTPEQRAQFELAAESYGCWKHHAA